MLQLSIDQEAAIDLLLVGKHDQEVADTIGVHRVTVTRWRLYHPQFRATLNERRSAVWQASRDTYQGLLHKSLAILESELDESGPQSSKIALAIVRSSSLTHADYEHPGPTEPDAVVDEVAKDEDARQLDRLIAGAHRDAILEDLLRRANEPPADDPEPARTPKTRVPRAKAAEG